MPNQQELFDSRSRPDEVYCKGSNINTGGV